MFNHMPTCFGSGLENTHTLFQLNKNPPANRDVSEFPLFDLMIAMWCSSLSCQTLERKKKDRGKRYIPHKGTNNVNATIDIDWGPGMHNHTCMHFCRLRIIYCIQDCGKNSECWSITSKRFQITRDQQKACICETFLLNC